MPSLSLSRPLPLILGVITFLGLAVTPAAPAAAYDVNDCGSSEIAFTQSDCTNTSVVEVPTPGQLLTKGDLLRNLSLYERYGYTRDFIETSPEITLTVKRGML